MEVLKPLSSKRGWTIVPVHYSHDPEKDAEWKDGMRQTYDRQEDWDREMELDFTAQLGAAAYPSFNHAIHVMDTIAYDQRLPLCLCCDFNVDPGIFEIAQIKNGTVYFIDEICMSPSNIPDMVEEFKNRYPDHAGGLHVYGDSNGLSRTAQTAKSDYDIMMSHFIAYPSAFKLRVPRAHPRSRDRINSFNHKLIGREDKPGIYICKTGCPELISDLAKVVMRPDGKDVLKSYKPKSGEYSPITSGLP